MSRLADEQPRPTRSTRALPPLAGEALLVVLAVALVLVELRPVFVEGRAAAGPYRLPDEPVGVLLLVAALLPVVARRRWPFAATVVGLGAALILSARAYVPFGAVELVALLLVYSAACHGRAVPRVAALGTLAAWLLVREVTQPFGFHLPGYAIECVVFGGAWMLGEFVRAQRRVADQLSERAALLERERESREREAAQSERLRIARELHDVIAHHLSVIVIQAQAANVALGREAGGAHDALTAIEASSREALTEMRRTLGLLRSEDGEGLDARDGRSPQPGLDALDALVAQLARAGLDVEVTVRGERTALPRAVDLSAYRIVQEALTNSLRHGGGTGGRPVAVCLRYDPERLVLEITNDGAGEGVLEAGGDAAGAHDGAAGGAGQIGMRERVALLGGELTFGRRGDGGYAVRVSLPLTGGAP